MVREALLNKRLSILNAARVLFERYTFEKTTMEEIAKAIPMSRGTLYTEFSSKQDILIALCRERGEIVATAMEETLAKSTTTYLKTLKACLRLFVELAFDLTDSIKSESKSMYASEKLVHECNDYFMHHVRFIERLLLMAADADEIPKNVNAVQTSEVIMNALASYLPPYPRHGPAPVERSDKERILREFDAMMNIFLRGLERPDTTSVAKKNDRLTDK